LLHGRNLPTMRPIGRTSPAVIDSGAEASPKTAGRGNHLMTIANADTPALGRRASFLRIVLGGLAAVLLVGGGFALYAYSFYRGAFQAEPMKVETVSVPVESERGQQVLGKFDEYRRTYVPRISFTEDEFNIWANLHLGEMETRQQFKQRVYFREGEIDLRLHLYLNDRKAWVNVEARGKPKPGEDGFRLDLSYARIGTSTFPAFLLPAASEQIEGYMRRSPVVADALDMMATCAVASGRLDATLHEDRYNAFMERHSTLKGKR
jgi:hypothetical protein